MTGPRAGTGSDARRLDQHAAPRVEAIGDDTVAAFARHVEEAALAIERDMVRIHAAMLEPAIHKIHPPIEIHTGHIRRA